MVLYRVFYGVYLFLQIINYVLLAYCILSWIVPRHNRIMVTLERFLAPLLNPIRSVLYRLLPNSPLDFSVLALCMILYLLQRLVWVLYGVIPK